MPLAAFVPIARVRRRRTATGHRSVRFDSERLELAPDLTVPMIDRVDIDVEAARHEVGSLLLGELDVREQQRAAPIVSAVDDEGEGDATVLAGRCDVDVRRPEGRDVHEVALGAFEGPDERDGEAARRRRGFAGGRRRDGWDFGAATQGAGRLDVGREQLATDLAPLIALGVDIDVVTACEQVPSSTADGHRRWG
jgi:hypothetical protein